MIESLKFKNYKCISDDITFNLNRINVFSGFNGRGKSSVIQAILMLSQSVKEGDFNSIQHLHLNGPFVQLGDYDEILSDDKDSKIGIKLGILTNDKKRLVDLEYDLSSDDIKVAELKNCKIDDEDYFAELGGAENGSTATTSSAGLKVLPAYINTELNPKIVHFISANRKGPVKYVDKRERPKTYSVGIEGEYTINTLHECNTLLSPSMNVDPDDDNRYELGELTTSWINYIMEAGSISVDKEDSAKDRFGNRRSSTLSMGFKFEGLGNNRAFNPYNVGYGYSYIMSIVVTALIAKPGDIVVIENPEAHLHPQAQLHLTYMLARLASTGVQLFIETHSEHVINGFRLAALKSEYKISNDDLRLYFFDKDYKIKPLLIEKNGRINNWPAHFFDQYQKELAEIMTLGAKIK